MAWNPHEKIYKSLPLPHTKMNLRWEIGINAKSKVMKLLEQNQKYIFVTMELARWEGVLRKIKQKH